MHYITLVFKTNNWLIILKNYKKLLFLSRTNIQGRPLLNQVNSAYILKYILFTPIQANIKCGQQLHFFSENLKKERSSLSK